MSGKIWFFGADVGPKTKIFGLHVKFHKIISLQKNHFFANKYLRKKSQKTFFFPIISHIYEDKKNFFPSEKLFSIRT